jgi:hypothetical protein
MNDKESLKKFMSGCYGIYAVTNWWDPENLKNWRQEPEVKQGQMLSDIADETGVEVYIWSTLPNAEKISKGKYKVAHFTHKAKVDEYIRSKQHQYKYIGVMPSCYYENFVTMMAPKQQEDGTFVFNQPAKGTGVWSLYSVAETGRVVAEVLKNVEKYVNKTVLMTAERRTLNDLVKQYGEVRGKKAILNELTDEQFISFFPPQAKETAEEIIEMCRFFDEYGYGDGKGALANEMEGKDIVQLSTFKQWLTKQTFKAEEESKA